MNWTWRIVGTVVLLISAIYLFGAILPVEHEASRSADFPRPPQDVYDLIADFRGYPTWWPEVQKVDVAVEGTNRTTFTQHTADGALMITVRERNPPSRYVTMIDPGQEFGGSWTFDIVETPTGSRLTITERGEIYSPMFRALARLVFGYTGTMESFLAAARQRLSSQ